MILKRNEAAQLSPEQEEFVGILERKINDWLSRKFSKGKQLEKVFRLSNREVSLIADKVTKELSDRFQRAGWKEVEIRFEVIESGMATDWGQKYHVLKITLGSD